MENFLDSRKRKLSDSLSDDVKVSFKSECESETVLSGGVLLSSVCFPRSLLMVAIIVEVIYSCHTVGRKLYLDLAAFPILPITLHTRCAHKNYFMTSVSNIGTH